MQAASQMTSVQQRSLMLRGRVRDALPQMGYGDLEYGKRRFVQQAVILGKAAGMRVWSDNTNPSESVGLNSLKTLLGEVTGNGRRGVNEHWVLDLWELVLHEHFHGAVRIVPQVVDEPEFEPAVESGVVVELPAVEQAKQDERLAQLPMRLMEAYLGREDETFMALLLEIEELAS